MVSFRRDGRSNTDWIEPRRECVCRSHFPADSVTNGNDGGAAVGGNSSQFHASSFEETSVGYIADNHNRLAHGLRYAPTTASEFNDSVERSFDIMPELRDSFDSMTSSEEYELLYSNPLAEVEGRLNAATANISVGRVVGRDLVRIAIDLTEYSEIKS